MILNQVSAAKIMNETEVAKENAMKATEMGFKLYYCT